MRNNQLGLNARVSHFSDKCTDKCTICRILNKQTTNREIFIHLFLTCPVTSRILGQFLTDYFIATPEPNSKSQDFCIFYWYGITDYNNNYITNIVLDLFRYKLWTFKLRRKVPTYRLFLDEFLLLIDCIGTVNKKIKFGIMSEKKLARLAAALG